MKGTDLKITPETAMKQLGREIERALEDIRATGKDLAEQLTVAGAAVKPIDLTHAEVAAVIDFTNCYDMIPRTQLSLSFNGGGSGGYVDLHNGIRKGRYRALITIERLGDLE